MFRNDKYQKWLHLGTFVEEVSETPWTPKEGVLECQAQKPQILQAMCESSKTLSRSISASQWKITQYREIDWKGKANRIIQARRRKDQVMARAPRS